jgi:hypothetical protein
MVATLVTEGTETAHKLPIPPAGFAVLALAAFGLLLLVTFAFRSVSNRH